MGRLCCAGSTGLRSAPGRHVGGGGGRGIQVDAHHLTQVVPQPCVVVAMVLGWYRGVLGWGRGVHVIGVERCEGEGVKKCSSGEQGRERQASCRDSYSSLYAFCTLTECFESRQAAPQRSTGLHIDAHKRVRAHTHTPRHADVGCYNSRTCERIRLPLLGKRAHLTASELLQADTCADAHTR